VYWGEDRKFWRESYYGLSQLKPGAESKIITALPDSRRETLLVNLVGQYILSAPQQDDKALTNRDFQQYEHFKSFQFYFHAIVDKRSVIVDDN
jgi:hypothetical protein